MLSFVLSVSRPQRRHSHKAVAAANRLPFQPFELCELLRVENALGPDGIDEVLANDDCHAEVSSQALQPARHVHPVADDGDREILRIAHVAGGDLPRVDPDAGDGRAAGGWTRQADGWAGVKDESEQRLPHYARFRAHAPTNRICRYGAAAGGLDATGGWLGGTKGE